MRGALLVAFALSCVPKPVVKPEPRCSLPQLPEWHAVAVQAQADGSALLAPADAAVMAANIRSLRGWAAQASACAAQSAP